MKPIPAVIMEDPKDQVSHRKSGMIIDDLDDDLDEVLQKQHLTTGLHKLTKKGPSSATSRRSRQMRKSGNVMNTTIGSYVERNSNGVRVIDDFSDNDSELIKLNDSSSFRRSASQYSHKQGYMSEGQSSIGGVKVIRANGKSNTGSDTSSYVGMKSTFGKNAKNYNPVIVDDMSSFENENNMMPEQDPLVFNSF